MEIQITDFFEKLSLGGLVYSESFWPKSVILFEISGLGYQPRPLHYLNYGNRQRNILSGGQSNVFFYGAYIIYNPSVRIIDLVSHTTYVSSGTYSLKSVLNDSFFQKLFMAVLIYSQSFCRTNTFCFDVWSGVSNSVFMSNMLTHYLLDYGDFEFYCAYSP